MIVSLVQTFYKIQSKGHYYSTDDNIKTAFLHCIKTKILIEIFIHIKFDTPAHLLTPEG